MQIVRPVQTADLDNLMRLAKKTGGGMTSMPADLKLLAKRIADSVKACGTKFTDKDVATYFMVLEDVETGDLVGTSAVYTNVGLNLPFYTYKVLRVMQRCPELDHIQETRLLTLTNDFTGSTEIGSLFLLPEFRISGNGSLLSRARYMLMGNRPERFGEKTIAEMRGFRDENDQSPVWEQLGKKFFGIAFDEADIMSGVSDKRFISDLMPKYPIYIDLLPKAAQEAIGVPFPASMPALKMLEKEGFKFTNYVDIFDGGPTVEAYTQDIYTIRQTQTRRISGFSDLPETKNKQLIATEGLADFKCCLADVEEDGPRIKINQNLADILGLKIGDRIKVAPGRVVNNHKFGVKNQ
ncbi:MAG: arginine N-succinyltransferase [Rhizobiales bacterium]|nr:arginine N-succinyltransferase [Hyphomicrobiales bacterium]NRB14364.1 arginine N-succinyltransferase [Hyphomicrobiales bacterium]